MSGYSRIEKAADPEAEREGWGRRVVKICVGRGGFTHFRANLTGICVEQGLFAHILAVSGCPVGASDFRRGGWRPSAPITPCPTGCLPDVLRDQARQKVVEGFDLELADGGFDMGAADAAVVGEEDVGAAGEDGEEAAHEFTFLGGAAAVDGDELDAVLGILFDGGLETFDDALVVLVGGSVQDEEGDAGAGRCVPGEVLQAGFQGRVDGFGEVAATPGMLHGDVSDGLVVVFGERGVFGHVIVAFVPVEDSAGAECDVALPAFDAVQDVHQVFLEEFDFVAHRSGGVHDESDVGVFPGRLGLVDDVEIHIGLFLLFVVGRHDGCLGLADTVDDEGKVVRGGFGVERINPQGGLSLIVRKRTPDGFPVLLQDDANGREPLAGGVRDADGHPARRMHPPILLHAAIFLGGHQLAPEVPVFQVVPFSGSQDAGLAAGTTGIVAPILHESISSGIGLGYTVIKKSSFRAGNESGEDRQNRYDAVFHGFFVLYRPLKPLFGSNLASKVVKYLRKSEKSDIFGRINNGITFLKPF